jgi:phosphosulfolactate phosphohydrolase-like enzyme
MRGKEWGEGGAVLVLVHRAVTVLQRVLMCAACYCLCVLQVRLPVDTRRADDPHVKAHLLLQVRTKLITA